jgi:uncharacterized membrane protein
MWNGVGRLATAKRLLGNVSGNVAIMGAILLPVGIAAAAIAVDEGSLYLERREAQSITDLAAIVAAANIDRAETAVLTTLEDNRHPDVTLIEEGVVTQTLVAGTWVADVRVQKGRYEPNPGVAPDARFVVGSEPANAVKVIFRKKGTRYFASRMIPAPTISTEAVASLPAEAAFSVGSRLLSLNGGILNSVLGKLLGTTISLSVMDYEALIDTDVSALGFLDALATELDITAGTYNDVLAANATVGQIVDALAAVSGQDREAQLALTAIGNAIPTSTTVDLPLSHLFDLGRVGQLALGQGDSGFDAAIGLMEVLGATAAVANGSNQISLNTGLAIPGLLSVTADLAIGEPPQNSPWFAIGEAGTIVRTAQTRLRLVASVGGPGGLLGTSIKVPIYLELAYAEAKLKSISCPSGRPESARVSVAAKPGVVELWLGEIDPTGLKNFVTKPVVQPAKIVQMPIVKITGSAHVNMGNLHPTTLTFTKDEIDDRTAKSVSSRNLTQSLTQSLLNDLDLTVKLDLGILSLGLVVPSEGALTSTVAGILGGVTAPLDTLLYNLLSAIGVKVGEADIRVNGVSCGRSVLVN